MTKVLDYSESEKEIGVFKIKATNSHFLRAQTTK